MAHHHRLKGTSLDCKIRSFALDFAKSLETPHDLNFVAEALELSTLCSVDPKIRAKTAHGGASRSIESTEKEIVVVVDFVYGSDSSLGTAKDPVQTIQYALSLIRKQRKSRTASILLRKGVHFLGGSLILTPQDSHTTIASYPGESASISGGVPLNVQWKRSTTHVKGVWTAYVTNKTMLPLGMPGLNLAAHPRKDRRLSMTRARHPNRDPDAGTMEKGMWNVENETWTKTEPWPKAATTVYLIEPNDTAHHAGDCGTHFTYGVGGPCERYSPSGGYLCSANASGGGFGWEEMVPGSPLFPKGLKIPASSFGKTIGSPLDWAPAEETGESLVVETWTNGWAVTMWEVGSVSSAGDGNVSFAFSKGGQQTGRGFHINPPSPGGKGRIDTEGPWKIENALELLDTEEEFFYNSKTGQVWLFYNGTGTPNDVEWIVPAQKRLVQVLGNQSSPVQNVGIHDVGFRDSAYTYMDEWGVPSGGDWALHRGGAVFLEGVENVSIYRSDFSNLDGNAVFLSKFTRDVTVENSSFSYIGDNAVAAWGVTESSGFSVEENALPDGVGIDGTAGDQPRRTRIVGNMVREIGMNERQSSAFGEFKACQSTVERNIFLNMPRAAINKNDGFGGGTLISKNLLFNTCRESGDHGPFNSWDRQPYLTAVRTGKPSLLPANNTLAENFIISNYGAGWGIDNDDTSSYYDIQKNFMYMGGGVKCDYAGHDKIYHDNILVEQLGGGGCHHTCAYKDPFVDKCFRNKIVQGMRSDTSEKLSDDFSVIWFCNAKDPSKLMTDYDNSALPYFDYENDIYNAHGAEANVTCGYSGPESSTTVPLSRFLELGFMNGTKVHPLPSADEIVAWGRELLLNN